MTAKINKINSNTRNKNTLVDKEDKITIPRGKPKSGRMWKSEKTRCKSMIKSRGLKLSFDKKQKLKEDLKRVKEASKAIVETRKQQKELLKERRRENLKKQKENEKKSEIVQVIKNPSKIKKMKRKQLRSIEKRDTTNM